MAFFEGDVRSQRSGHFVARHADAGIKNLYGVTFTIEAYFHRTFWRILLTYRVDRVLAQLSQDVPVVVVAINDVLNQLPFGFVTVQTDYVYRFLCRNRVHGSHPA